MAKDREDEPKIQIIDRRMLTEEERAGRGSGEAAPSIITSSSAPAPADSASRLEIVGGGSPAAASDQPVPSSQQVEESDAEELLGETGEEFLTEEDAEELRKQIEEEQFGVLEKQFGRPLTDAEKEQVRGLMDQQAQSMTRLEVSPLVLRTLTELPSFAVVHLGLRPNPYTGLIARNDAEARLAIEAFGALYDVVKSRIDARASAELGRVLNDLRSNYTRITGAQLGQSGGPRIIH